MCTFIPSNSFSRPWHTHDLHCWKRRWQCPILRITQWRTLRLLPIPVHFWSTSAWIWNRAKERLRDCSMWNIPLLQVACYQRHYWAYFHDCSEEIWKLPGRHLSRNSSSCAVINRSVEYLRAILRSYLMLPNGFDLHKTILSKKFWHYIPYWSIYGRPFRLCWMNSWTL